MTTREIQLSLLKIEWDSWILHSRRRTIRSLNLFGRHMVNPDRRRASSCYAFLRKISIFNGSIWLWLHTRCAQEKERAGDRNLATPAKMGSFIYKRTLSIRVHIQPSALAPQPPSCSLSLISRRLSTSMRKGWPVGKRRKIDKWDK